METLNALLDNGLKQLDALINNQSEVTGLDAICDKANTFEKKIKQFSNAKKLRPDGGYKMNAFDKSICETLRPTLLEQRQVKKSSYRSFYSQTESHTDMFQFKIGFDKETIAKFVFAEDEYEPIALMIGEFADSRLTVRFENQYDRRPDVHGTTYFNDHNSVFVPRRETVLIMEKKTEALQAFPILGRIRDLNGIVANWVKLDYQHRPDLVGKTWPLELSFEDRYSLFDRDSTMEYLLCDKQLPGQYPRNWSKNTVEAMWDDIQEASDKDEVKEKWIKCMHRELKREKAWNRLQHLTKAMEKSEFLDGEMWNYERLQKGLFKALKERTEEAAVACGTKRKREDDLGEQKKQKVGKCALCGTACTERHQLSKKHFNALMLCHPEFKPLHHYDKRSIWE